MIRLHWTSASATARVVALARPPRGRDGAVAARVAEIFADVEARGTVAVAEWAVRLDGFAPRAVTIDAAAVTAARASVSDEDADALGFAADAVRRYHEATRPRDSAPFETIPGASVTRVWRPIETAGLYVPGGTAPLFSTLLMLAVPAAVAGVRNRVAITPPAKDGGAHPMMVLAAHRAGLDTLWLLGGAHGIAALALGAGVPRATKIFGPGNVWVTEAKRQAADRAGGPAIDMPAGPSELMVVADGGADPRVVAADLLSQAEHDADAQVVLVALGAGVADAVMAEVAAQVALLPRAETARAALASSRVLVVAGVDEALDIINAYAPEHLSMNCSGADALVARIRSAGTVFVGPHTAETFGDYLSGPSHVLPTDGAARAWSGVSVASFMTSFAVQTATREGAARLAPMAARLARAEGLEAHARAADLRSITGRSADETTSGHRFVGNMLPEGVSTEEHQKRWQEALQRRIYREFDASAPAWEPLAEGANGLNLSPPDPEPLRQRLASLWQLPSECVTPTLGVLYALNAISHEYGHTRHQWAIDASGSPTSRELRGGRPLVVIEDGIEFAGGVIESRGKEAIQDAGLFVIRTLSAYGISSANLSVVIHSDSERIPVEIALASQRIPLPLQRVAEAALSTSRMLANEARIETVKVERARMAAALGVPETITSWLSLPTADLDTFDRLGIRAEWDEDNWFNPVPPARVRVGTPEQNDLVLAAMGVPVPPRPPARRAEFARDTKETRIVATVDLGRAEPVHVATGIGFYDHMIEQVARHAGFSCTLACEGDLHIEAHHTIEDSALALGEALRQALGDRKGVARFGFVAPLDEAEAAVTLDLSGRPFLKFEGEFKRAMIGEYPTEMTAHVFRSLADAMRATIHVKVTGEDDHHKTEAAFKAFGRALRQAIRVEGDAIPSTKGVLA